MGLKLTTCCVGSSGFVEDLLLLVTVRESMVSSTFGAEDLGVMRRGGEEDSGEDMVSPSSASYDCIRSMVNVRDEILGDAFEL